MRDRLKEIPPRLNDLFQMILTRDDENRDQLKACLTWILFASRPLKPPELYFAVQFKCDKECSGFWDKEDIVPDEMKAFVRSSSKGLAEVKASEVQFIHESVRDFLLGSYGEQWSEEPSNLTGHSHEFLKDCCLAQLMSEDIDLPESLPKTSQAVELRSSINLKFPFLEYAIINLFCHSNAAQKNGIEQKDFLNNLPLQRWILFNNALEKHGNRRYTGSARLFYIFSEKDLPDLISIQSDKDYFEVGDERYGLPIFAALATNSHKVVEAFLRFQGEVLPQESAFHDLYKIYCQHKDIKASIGRSYVFTRKRGVFYHLLKDFDEIFVAAYLSSNTPDMDISSMDSSGRTPLHYSIEKGYTAVLTALLVHDDLNINILDTSGKTPLFYAIKSGNEAATKALLVNIQDKYGRTPLFYAVEHGNEAVVKTLLAHTGIDVNIEDIHGMTLLSYTAESGNEAALKALLAYDGIDVNINNKHGKTPLLQATGSGHKNVVKLLLDNNANPDSADEDGRTPLSWAANRGYENIIQLLLDNNANPNSADKYGRTPLSWAAENGNNNIIQMLLNKNANPNSAEDGRTPLSWAANRGHENIVQLLLDNNANIKSVDQAGWTPLLQAANRGHENIAKLLLNNNANIESVDMFSQTALSIAVLNGYESIVKLLLDNNANIESVDRAGWTPLSRAANEGHENIIQLLLDKNANIESTDAFGQTALSIATERGFLHIIELLQAKIS